MACIDHWHPILLSEQLTTKPVGVKWCGQQVVFFRTADGRPAALTDSCPHRRMRLSLGKVVNGKLQCKYHGWSFDHCGQGESPGTPKLHACAENYSVREEYGAVWIKSRDSNPEFPQLPVEGLTQMCILKHEIPAPLEVTMDNFCEIEHTPTTHDVFGYPLERMHEVSVKFEWTDTTVRVMNVGPPKQLPWWMRRLLGSRKHYLFYDEWTTYFSPCYSVYDHWWADPVTGRESKVRWKNIHFFWPIDDHNTGLTTWTYARSRHPVGPSGGLKPFRWLMRKLVDREVQLDVEILKGLASADPSIEGMKLSRFDKVLGLNRERIDRIYRGKTADTPSRQELPTHSVAG